MCSSVFDVFIIIFAAVLIHFVNSQIPSVQDKDAVILEHEYIPPDERGYTFRYRTSNGIERSEQGTFAEADQILRVKGQYRYPIGGQIYEVSYSADENGYVAKQVVAVTGQDSNRQKGFEKVPETPASIGKKPPGRIVGRNKIGGATLASLAGGGLG